MDVTLVVILAIAYLVGNISPGWLLVRLRRGGDVRQQGSGGTGATNTARALGRWWFYVVLALDILKAACAVNLPWLAFDGRAPLTYFLACGIAVITGHIWPVLLGFRGGKGVGPFLGVWLGMGSLCWLYPFTLLGPILAGLFFLPLRKGAFMCALCGLMGQPLCFWLVSKNALAAALAAVIVLLIQFAHRSNFKNAFCQK